MRTMIFFFNDTATTEIYTLSLHDALPILRAGSVRGAPRRVPGGLPPAGKRALRPAPPRPHCPRAQCAGRPAAPRRSEEHTSELQSRQYLVCRLLLEKKKMKLILFCVTSIP